MVMHARKLPRLDDGYFDKHQSHTYQANPKYSSSKGNYDRYNERPRDSPNGTGLRSDSPNSFGDSPRERSYMHKGSYAQRIREKERERDNRSPRERERQREVERRINHERGTSTEEKPQRVGDWSEHVSSSGKKYYYNCKSEVSQWEKPREWVDWEKDKEHERDRERYRRDRDRDRERKYERSYSSRGASGPSDRHSSFNRPTMSNSNSSNSNLSSSRTTESRDNHRNHPPLQHSLSEPAQPRRHSYERPSQDMDISPADSTPTSETSGPKVTTPYTPDPRLTPTTGSATVSLATTLPRLLSHPPTSTSNQSMRPGGLPTNASSSRTPNLMSPVQTSGAATSAATTATSLSSLQQLLTQLTRTNVSGSMTAINPAIQSMLASTLGRMGNITALGSLQNLEHMELPAHEVLQSLQTLLSSSQIPVPTSNVANALPKNMNSLGLSSSNSDGCQGSASTPPESDPASGTNGPPTPTHSERLDAEFRRGSPATSLSSLSAAAASLRPPSSSSHALTPSLAAYFRPELISHVTGWPAEQLEKQANKLSEELHTIGNLHITRVSAELKMARSLVRVADIQATLQEQRILFLRQQMKELEELKPPNHFMSD